MYIPEYLGCLYTGSCVVKPSHARCSTEELFNMVKLCGLNRMTTYGTWLAPQIQAAKKNPELLRLLQEMRTVSYGGVPISVADDDWCFQNGIPLMVGVFCSIVANLLNNSCERTCMRRRNAVCLPSFTLYVNDHAKVPSWYLFPESPLGICIRYQAYHTDSILQRTPLTSTVPPLPDYLNSSYSLIHPKFHNRTFYQRTETSTRATCSRDSPTDRMYSVVGTTTGSKAKLQILSTQS